MKQLVPRKGTKTAVDATTNHREQKQLVPRKGTKTCSQRLAMRLQIIETTRTPQGDENFFIVRFLRFCIETTRTPQGDENNTP